jgi:hypothetical protein
MSLDGEARDDASGSPPARLELRYRAWNGSLPPRRIKLAIPGWAGTAAEPVTGSEPQPWHCRPFVDAASYGIELVYAFETECRVSRRGADIHFEADFSAEIAAAAERGEFVKMPSGSIAPHHHGLTSALDIMPPPGHVLRLEPHPRFFTDHTGSVPAAVPGHLERFWPRMFFMVFKAPAPGEVHVFRQGDPIAQLLVVPSTAGYRLEPMSPEVAADRRTQDYQMSSLAWLLGKHLWRASNGLWFEDKYKQLLRIYRSGGLDAVREHLAALAKTARLDPEPPPGSGSGPHGSQGG